MTAKSFIFTTYLCARSIFRWPRRGQDALPEKSNTGQILDAGKLAVDHWRYVEGVLLRHGVPAADVSWIGEAYLSGFLRGWALAWYSRLFGVSVDAAAEWEWLRWAAARSGYPVGCCDHFREAFLLGWKHRCEVGA